MASSGVLSTRLCALVAFVLSVSLQLQLVHGQATTTSAAAPSQTSTSATVYPGTASWVYYGCWNETTGMNQTGGVRALTGALEAADTMTVQTCLDFCSGKGLSLAGLEYTRECYCADHLSAFSNKLDDSKCNLACMGNSTQVCGGSLTLTVYQSKKSSTGGAASTIPRDAPVGSILALGIAMGTLFCLA